MTKKNPKSTINNKKILRSKVLREDNYFTRLCDINDELPLYSDQYKDKILYCNADEFGKSNFIRHLLLHRDIYQFKELYATAYNAQGQGSFYHYINDGIDGDGTMQMKLSGNGSFDSRECLDILDRSDIVISNPPFSKLTRYMDVLMKFGKKFLIVSSITAPNYKSMRSHFENEDVRYGVNFIKYFAVPDDYRKIAKWENGVALAQINAPWITNLQLDNAKPHFPLHQGGWHHFPTYDNYPNILHIEKAEEIPKYYCGLMSVSTSFAKHFSYDQFAMIKFGNDLFLNGSQLFVRLIICHRKYESLHRSKNKSGLNHDLFLD